MLLLRPQEELLQTTLLQLLISLVREMVREPRVETPLAKEMAVMVVILVVVMNLKLVMVRPLLHHSANLEWIVPHHIFWVTPTEIFKQCAMLGMSISVVAPQRRNSYKIIQKQYLVLVQLQVVKYFVELNSLRAELIRYII
jgi:hypothetical protein